MIIHRIPSIGSDESRHAWSYIQATFSIEYFELCHGRVLGWLGGGEGKGSREDAAKEANE